MKIKTPLFSISEVDEECQPDSDSDSDSDLESDEETRPDLTPLIPFKDDNLSCLYHKLRKSLRNYSIHTKSDRFISGKILVSLHILLEN